ASAPHPRPGHPASHLPAGRAVRAGARPAAALLTPPRSRLRTRPLPRAAGPGYGPGRRAADRPPAAPGPRPNPPPPVQPPILLFDVDGTLLSAAGAGRRALERAFEAHCGTAASLRDVRFNGMTDPGIVRAGLEQLGRPAGPALVAAILDDYVPLLADE